MLYDPKWEVETKKANKVNPVSLEGLISWLETQDPATRYSYGDNEGCLLARYFRASGYRWAYCGPDSFSYSLFFLPPIFRKKIPLEMDDVALHVPSTYGAALERARAALR